MMAGRALTDQATMMCPHGGTVSATASGSMQADGGTVLLMTDSCTISGCSFQLPTTPPTPSPCVRVQWVTGEFLATANGTPILSESSVGLCMAGTGLVQGTVQVSDTQSAVNVG